MTGAPDELTETPSFANGERRWVLAAGERAITARRAGEGRADRYGLAELSGFATSFSRSLVKRRVIAVKHVVQFFETCSRRRA